MILLDTNALLRLDADRMAARPRRRIEKEAEAGRAFISAISAFEIGHLHNGGRILARPSPREWWEKVVTENGLGVLPVTASVALRGSDLGAPLDGDPGDRIIVATALEHDLTLFTRDRSMLTFAKAGSLKVEEI